MNLFICYSVAALAYFTKNCILKVFHVVAKDRVSFFLLQNSILLHMSACMMESILLAVAVRNAMIKNYFWREWFDWLTVYDYYISWGKNSAEAWVINHGRKLLAALLHLAWSHSFLAQFSHTGLSTRMFTVAWAFLYQLVFNTVPHWYKKFFT